LTEGPEAHLGLALFRGQFAVQANDPAAALRQFRLAMRLDPTNRVALQGLSLVLKQLGNAEEAALIQKRTENWRHLTSLLQKSKTVENPRERTLLTQLAETCEALGRRAEARAWYRLALGLDPLDQQLQRALYRLRDSSPSVDHAFREAAPR
jgi:Flp pilus assembly protein TadD